MANPVLQRVQQQRLRPNSGHRNVDPITRKRRVVARAGVENRALAVTASLG